MDVIDVHSDKTDIFDSLNEVDMLKFELKYFARN